MKKLKCILTSVLVASAPISTLSAANILIDFGLADGAATGNYSNVNAGGLTGGSSISTLTSTTFDLLDFSSGLSVGSLDIASTATSAFGEAGSQASYTGSKPTEVSAFQAAALNDGLFLNGAAASDATLIFTGLDGSTEYEFLIYGARGNNGNAADFSTVVGTGGSDSISNVFNNATEVASFTATSTASGELSILWSRPSSGGNPSAINFMSITTVPESSTYALIAGLFGLMITFVRRLRK